MVVITEQLSCSWWKRAKGTSLIRDTLRMNCGRGKLLIMRSCSLSPLAFKVILDMENTSTCVTLMPLCLFPQKPMAIWYWPLLYVCPWLFVPWFTYFTSLSYMTSSYIFTVQKVWLSTRWKWTFWKHTKWESYSQCVPETFPQYESGSTMFVKQDPLIRRRGCLCKSVFVNILLFTN